VDIRRIVCTNACSQAFGRAAAPTDRRCADRCATTPPFTAQASLFALTQCLPGPSSTQLATALGGLQAGLPGAIAAFVCFDLPGFVVLATSGVTLRMYKDADFDEGLMGVLATMQKGLGAASVSSLPLPLVRHSVVPGVLHHVMHRVSHTFSLTRCALRSVGCGASRVYLPCHAP
jgi:hypothetical protein